MMLIGIDLDNTIINYGDLFVKEVRRKGWIKDRKVKTKSQVRECVRRLPNGEQKWRTLQALVYGARIKHAKPYRGVLSFIRTCHARGISTVIVSHKTQEVNVSGKRINLRKAAMNWLAINGFINPVKTGLDLDRVFFEVSRAGKLARIRKLCCTHFIDDLEEVLEHSKFPSWVKRCLFTPGKPRPELSYFSFSRWGQIKESIFDYVDAS